MPVVFEGIVVPQESEAELERSSGEFTSDADHVRAIAGPVVLRELRSMAGVLSTAGQVTAAKVLLDRAGDLERIASS